MALTQMILASDILAYLTEMSLLLSQSVLIYPYPE